jgi:hypothetical protein
MPFNPRRAEQPVAQLGHQGDRRVNIKATIGNRASERVSILRRKVS